MEIQATFERYFPACFPSVPLCSAIKGLMSHHSRRPDRPVSGELGAPGPSPSYTAAIQPGQPTERMGAFGMPMVLKGSPEMQAV